MRTLNWNRISKNLSRTAAACVIAGALSIPSQTVDAAGFYIQEQSVSGLGTSYAGQVAKARDSSILFYNPAGLTHLDQRQVNVGIHWLAPHADVVDTGTTAGGPLTNPSSSGENPGQPTFVPNAYFATPITEDNKWWAGLGFSAPFGLGAQYSRDFFGRFSSTKSSLTTIDIQPTLAYQPTEWLSIGVTGILQYADANLKQFAALGAGAVPEAEVSIKGNDWSGGYNVGLMIQPLDTTTIGVSYRSEIHHKLVGNQEAFATSPATDADADLSLPDIFQIGVSHDIDDKWTVMGSALWTGWNEFDRLITNPDDPAATSLDVSFNYQTTWAYSIGLEYKWDDDLTLRTGYQYDATPTTDETRSTLNPDGDRNWFSVGATYKWDEAWSFDFAATYIDIEEEEINIQRGIANVVAETEDAYVGILALGINYKF